MAGLKVHRTVSSRPNWTGMSWRIWLRPFESNIGGGGGAIYDLLELLSGVRPQAVTDALVLMQTGRALAARRVLEALEEDLSHAAALTRCWAAFIANEPAGKPS